MGKIIIIISLVLHAVLSNFIFSIFRDGELPKLADGYWGPRQQELKSQDTKIYPFKIDVKEPTLQSLKSKLEEEINSGRFTKPLDGIGFEYGMNTNYLQKVLNYWHKKYDWRGREKLLNKYPQFKTKIEGLDIHFQHVKSSGKYKKTLPLLVLHGWPGSFVEHQKIIPLLSEPEKSDFNFEVVVPSLPGYGFSDAAQRPGLGPVEAAGIFLKLMQRLGHEKFYVQGGDWGSVIVINMATRFPKNVIALHSNMCLTLHPKSIPRTLLSNLLPSLFMSPEEIDRFFPMTKLLKFVALETGYMHIQATKPDTVGVALSQSPAGLAAYFLEKFSTWTNEAGVNAEDGLIPQLSFTMDELLDNIMVYWVTNTITSSMRFYAENFSPREMSLGLDRVPVSVPTACYQSLDPYASQCEFVLRAKFPNLVRYTMGNKGGHFLAMEEPKLLANDIFQFVNQLK